MHMPDFIFLLLNLILKKQATQLQNNQKLPSDLFLYSSPCSGTSLWAFPFVSWTGRVADRRSSSGFSGNTKRITKGSDSLLSAKQKAPSELVKPCFSKVDSTESQNHRIIKVGKDL